MPSTQNVWIDQKEGWSRLGNGVWPLTVGGEQLYCASHVWVFKIYYYYNYYYYYYYILLCFHDCTVLISTQFSFSSPLHQGGRGRREWLCGAQLLAGLQPPQQLIKDKGWNQLAVAVCEYQSSNQKTCILRRTMYHLNHRFLFSTYCRKRHSTRRNGPSSLSQCRLEGQQKQPWNPITDCSQKSCLVCTMFIEMKGQVHLKKSCLLETGLDPTTVN